MRNIRLIISYEGTQYSGWQIQPKDPTVQGVIEDRLLAMTQGFCRLRAAGRTDAGVHACGQMANFLTPSRIPTKIFYRGLNGLLPTDIAINSVEEVSLDFDTRRHNRGKHYRYTILNQRHPRPDLAAWTYHIHRPLDVLAMAAAARSLVGTHDFSAFRAASCERENTIRTLYRCTVSRESSMVYIDVEGTAFLKNMVRIIAGTLLEVGQGRREVHTIQELLDTGNRQKGGMTLPPHGLCLMKVFL